MGIKRKPFGCCVSICSLILLAMLCLVMGMAVQFQRKRYFAIPGEIDDRQKMIVGVVVAALALGFIALLFGVASGCVKHRFVSVTFGICLTPVWIMLFVAAIFMGGLVATSDGEVAE